MRVAMTILRDRIFEEVRVKRQLSYAPNAELNTFSANTANIYVTAVDANQSVSVMLDEIKKIKSEKVDDQEISGVAGQFLTTYYIGQESNIAQAAELAKYELIGGGWHNTFDFLDKVRQVKPEDVQRVSQSILKTFALSPSVIRRRSIKISFYKTNCQIMSRQLKRNAFTVIRLRINL